MPTGGGTRFDQSPRLRTAGRARRNVRAATHVALSPANPAVLSSSMRSGTIDVIVRCRHPGWSGSAPPQSRQRRTEAMRVVGCGTHATGPAGLNRNRHGSLDRARVVRAHDERPAGRSRAPPQTKPAPWARMKTMADDAPSNDHTERGHVASAMVSRPKRIPPNSTPLDPHRRGETTHHAEDARSDKRQREHRCQRPLQSGPTFRIPRQHVIVATRHTEKTHSTRRSNRRVVERDRRPGSSRGLHDVPHRALYLPANTWTGYPLGVLVRVDEGQRLTWRSALPADRRAE